MNDLPEERNWRQPTYPEITHAQWAVLSAMTDQRCEHMMEAMDFYADLSPEAKNFLKSADKNKISELEDNLNFFHTSKAIWRFVYIGGGMLVGGFVLFGQFWKTFGDYFTIKVK